LLLGRLLTKVAYFSAVILGLVPRICKWLI
jgi:hypothetical protein